MLTSTMWAKRSVPTGQPEITATSDRQQPTLRERLRAGEQNLPLELVIPYALIQIPVRAPRKSKA